MMRLVGLHSTWMCCVCVKDSLTQKPLLVVAIEKETSKPVSGSIGPRVEQCSEAHAHLLQAVNYAAPAVCEERGDLQ